jgi:hypothetical protein
MCVALRPGEDAGPVDRDAGNADADLVLGDPCATGDDCEDDEYCEPTSMRCVAWGMPPGYVADDMCARVIVAGTFSPTVQCEFSAAPAGDAFPAHLHVLGTPMVADFRIDSGPDDPPRPSIVVVFDDGSDGGSEEPTGVIRILDGETCAQQAELGSLQLVSHSSPPAIGDLDGDGFAEIVANKAGGGLVAFKHDAGVWRVLWRSTQADGVTAYDPAGQGWNGPSLYDVDDDGSPEIHRGGIVLDAMGRLMDDSLGTFSYSQGIFAVIANVDDDPAPEHVQGQGVWQWDTAARRWAPEAWSPGGGAAGQVAIADFGAFPGGLGWPATAPEVVVITSGEARVQTLDGAIVFGPVALPGGGTGGPPTIADFDGDGRPELATAGAAAYTVFDLDCGAAPIGACGSGRADGILWSQPAQDASSNVTGSSVFDFEGDGRAEAVYGDECFLRVYDGAIGTVIFSQYRSSCTWYENPVIADLDGDFNAEIVIGNNFNCGAADSGVPCSGLGPRDTDPIFPGTRCTDGADCVSGRCDMGLCRCDADADCCAGAGCAAAALVCETPIAGTPGTGNVCRAAHPRGALGIRVYRDASDNWVRSRMIWNQHAYHVTNVNDDGTIPRTSAAGINWTSMGLNNFRANVQGDADPGAAPDLTSRGTPVSCDAAGVAILGATACNRGAEPVGAGLRVSFYDGDPDTGGPEICSALTTRVLAPGECETVSCAWMGAPTEPPGRDVTVVADSDGATGECLEGNNRTLLTGVRCSGLM